MTVGIGTTSISGTSNEETNIIRSSLGLTRGTNSSQNIISSLRDDRDQKINQRESVNDILILTDVTIDGYDKLIINMDEKVPGLIKEINDSITPVKEAYEQRISAGCLSDLKWIKTGEVTRPGFYSKSGFTGNITYQYWEVKKDPQQYRQINYYGFKYYKRPHNRDYGVNIVKEIRNSSVGVGSTYIIVYDLSDDALAGIQTGDIITDSIEDPKVFGVGNLPEILGFGSTSILGITTTFSGDISIGSTILKHTGFGIVTSGISTGDFIVRSGVTSENTVVVGFGTTTAEIEILDDEGEVGIVTSVVDSLILSAPAIGSTTFGEFNVKSLSFFPIILIDKITAISVDNASFIAIRTDSSFENEFDYRLNGSSPVEIGLIKNSTKIGYGHTAKIINNGDPDIITNWVEVIDPEPRVGAGFAPYYVGALSWPGVNTLVGFTYSFHYATEGTKVVIGIGLTTPQPVLTTTSTKPPGSADTSQCNTYTANITSAEANMNATITQNLPKINYYVNASKVLRSIRDDKENTAWSLKRGVGFLTEEIKILTEQISTLENTDFSEFE